MSLTDEPDGGLTDQPTSEPPVDKNVGTHPAEADDASPPLTESLASMIELFRQETGYPTEADKEQERLRTEWAIKLAPENTDSLSREDLLSYTSNAVDYGTYVVRREGLRQQWITDLDDAQYHGLLKSIRDLCWGEDELSIRIDRLVDRVGGFNRDTGAKGFTGIQVSRTLAICHPKQFLPTPSQIGRWGREKMLRALSLPEPQGSYGQRVVDANDRLRDHLAPYFENDTSGMAAFLYWLKGQTTEDSAPSAWLIRGGRDGEFEEHAIDESLACIGWSVRQLPDLRDVDSRDQIAELVREALPEASDGRVSAWVGQLWRFKTEIHRGDLVVMPMKTTSQIAVGVVSHEYWCRDDIEPDTLPHVAPPHVISVDWQRTDVPRSALKDDLLASLGSQLTICAVRAKDAAWRLQQLIESGNDPGPREEYGDNEASNLSTLIEQFRSETSFPTRVHEEQEQLRREWAEKLAPETIKSLSREDLTAFTNHAVNNGEYVRRVGGVMQWISALGEPEFDNLLDNIKYLCWGKDELSVRFDQLYVGYGPRKVKGYAGVNISRTLAICHPNSFLPVHRNVGNWGRAKMLSKLGLPAPLGNTPGQRVVDANNRLLEHLGGWCFSRCRRGCSVRITGVWSAVVEGVVS